MIGKCLCGEVQFEVKGQLPHLYQCHCSLCRKTTGSSANAATLVDKANFVWLAGVASIRSFVKDTGYRVDFCSVCGSPVPNALRGSELSWVPAGLLEANDGYQVVVHLHTASKAPWDDIGGGVHYEQMPGLDMLYKALQRTSR